ncbi:putative coil containing protein [Vibrio phage 193E37-1]|nr:putative coil containing protein [Vibrio phage 193E37-1]
MKKSSEDKVNKKQQPQQPYQINSHHKNLKNFRGDECIDDIQKDNTEASFSYSQDQRKTHGNISHDYLEWLADNFTVPIAYDKQGNSLPKPWEQRSLRLADGKVNVDLALVCMGFTVNQHTGQADYTLLSNVQRKGNSVEEGTEENNNEVLTQGVYIRNNKCPYLVREQLVYSGTIRSTSYAKGLYEEYEILTGDFATGLGDIKNILDIGTLQWYEKNDIRQGELRVLAEDTSVCEE